MIMLFGKRIGTIVMILLIMGVLPPVAFAAVPRIINYQGYLTGSDGVPVNRSVVMYFSLYDDPAGGTLLWSEQQTVTVANGRYSVNMGTVTSLLLAFDRQYFLGIRIDSDPEMTPRQPFSSAPYALRAAVADTVEPGSISTTALADGSVTVSKLGFTCPAGQVLLALAGSEWGCGSIVTGSTGTNVGSVTGVVAGAGLTGGGLTGTVLLDVNFGGNGTASTVSRSDHDHDALYQKRYGRVAVVAKTGSSYATPSAALADVVSWCGTPSEQDPCLVKMLPGTYDVGAIPLTMLAHVDIEGSGSRNTFITGAVDGTATGAVIGATATLARLSVKNSGGGGLQSAVAIYNGAAGLNLVDVTASAGGAAANFGVYNTGSADLNNVTARGDGGATGIGLYSNGTGTVRVNRSALEGTTSSVSNDGGGTMQVLYSTFTGGPAANLGASSMSCAASTDASGKFHESTCPPFSDLSVIATQPSWGCWEAGCFPANGLIKAQFSNDMNPFTISGGTFRVYDDTTGAHVTGVVSYDAVARSAIFAPSAPLTAQYYRAVVTTAATDAAGGRLPGDYEWTFTSGGTKTTPLSVIQASPSPGSVIEAAANISITVTFDRRIDTMSITGANMTVTDAGGNAVAGTVSSYDAVLYFVPKAKILFGSTYTITVSNVKDQAGNGMARPYGYSFSVGAAPISLTGTGGFLQTILSWQNVPGATSYNLYWSNTPGVTKQNGSKISGVTSPYIHAGLSSGLTYYYVLTAVIGTNEGAESAETSVLVDNRPQNVVATQGDRQATLTWSDVPGATSYNIYWSNVSGVTKANGSKIAGVTSPYTHSGLMDGLSYYYVVTADLGGSEGPESRQVMAIADATPPTVLSTVPGNNAAGVETDAVVCISFSEPIDASTWNNSTVTVTDAAGTPVALGFAMSSYGKCAGPNFQPYPALFAVNTTYTVTITGVKDLAGNVMASPVQFSFTTLTVRQVADLVATASGSQITLTWSPVAGASSYNLYWSLAAGVTKLNSMKIADVTSPYVHGGLTNNSTYYYVVTAVQGGVESRESAQVWAYVDAVPMKVNIVIPNELSVVQVNDPICVYFGKDIPNAGYGPKIDPSTWNSTTMSVKDEGGNTVTGMFFMRDIPGYSCGSAGVGFAPMPLLSYDTTYTVTISGVKDIAGNGLTAPYSGSFKTIAAP